ncbi:MAG TPA: hypothetical protein VFJ19_00520 [Nocardioidaceae bacterium]|nr:hypothetical protein [Nocardioidaceae bacterium]
MGLLTRVVEVLRGRANQPGEADAPADNDSAPSCATGGERAEKPGPADEER